MDRSMIGRYVDVSRFLLRGAPAPTLVQQLEVSASTISTKARLSFQRLSLNGFSSPINMQYLDG